METEIKSREYTLTAAQANAKSLLFVLPVVAISALPYLLLHGVSRIGSFDGGILLAAFLAGVVIHELIHGLCWGMCAKNGFRSIKFGIIWKALTPYCHCNEALSVRNYRIGSLMPTILLGFIPVILSWITGNWTLLIYGIMMTIGGAGDFLILWMMRKLPAREQIKDHPSKVGFYIPGKE